MRKNRSLQRELTIKLISVIALFYFFAAGISFYYAYLEAQEFQDDILKQVAHYSGDTSNIPPSTEALKLSDQESSIFVFHLPHDKLPDWLNKSLSLGFQDIETPYGKMRVFINDDEQGRDIATQLTEGRDELAVNSALRSLVPLLVLLPLIAVLVAQFVRKEFKLINARSIELDQQASTNLQSISLENLPLEIIPFFSATNRLIDRVKSLIASKRRFIANASHELRTPITALALQVDNLYATNDINEIRNRLLPLKNTVKRTRILAEQLLSYSKYEINQPNLKDFDFLSLLKKVIENQIAFASSKESKIDLHVESNLKSIKTDEQIFRTILNNLIQNAIKFSPPKSVIKIDTKTVDIGIQIQIIDNGPGIPEESKKAVFEPFVRLVESEIEGSGLGLAIVKDCLFLINGKIHLENRSDQISGLIVTIILQKY